MKRIWQEALEELRSGRNDRGFLMTTRTDTEERVAWSEGFSRGFDRAVGGLVTVFALGAIFGVLVEWTISLALRLLLP